MGIMPHMLKMMGFTGTFSAALAASLALVSCDDGAGDKLTSMLTGSSVEEHQMLQQQLAQSREALARLDLEIKNAESGDARLSYDLKKRLNNPGKLRTPFTEQDIDNLPAKRRDFEHLCFDIEDMRKTLARRKQEFHALQYQYDAYAAKLDEFKKSHPID